MRLILVLALLAPVCLANDIIADHPVRLKEHRVTATVTDRVATVVVEQTFRNEGKRMREGTYLFPLPRDAAVSDFAMTMGGKLVKGEVLDADRARDIYRSIVRRKRDPGLLEHVGRGLFRARVFPILPRRNIRIRLTYRHVLPENAGTIEFRYPLASGPESALVDLRFESTVDLKSVFSPSHTVSVDREGRRDARVVYESSGRTERRDLVVYFGRAAEDVGFSLLSSNGTFLAVLAPNLELRPEEIVPKDVVYVLDTSGSMQGEKIVQAKEALRTGIKMLRKGDRFGIVGFSSERVAFRPRLVGKTERSARAADEWLGKIHAGGGTALEEALTYALALPAENTRLRMVVLLTDGRPTIGVRDADEILARVKKANGQNARVFTFGVGHDLDVKLLDRIAEATNGARQYVEPHERIDAVTARFFRLTDAPVMTDLELVADDGISQVYPKRLPDLFAGGQVVLLGRYDGAGERKITLRGTHRGKRVEYVYAAAFAADDRAPYLERMWAQRKVAFLLDEIRLHGEEPELVTEVKRLATLHSIVTRYTAGLVVEGGERITASTPLHFRSPSGGVPAGMREPSDPQPPADTGVAGPTTPGMPPVAESKALKKRKQAITVPTGGFIRSVAGKTFKWTTKQRWIDSAWDGKGEPTRIEAFSDAYFDLIDKDKRIARYLALGNDVLFVHEGTVYEVYTGGA